MHWLYANEASISTIWMDPTKPNEAFPVIHLAHNCNSCAEDGNEVMLYFIDNTDLAAFSLGIKEMVDSYIERGVLRSSVERAVRDGIVDPTPSSED